LIEEWGGKTVAVEISARRIWNRQIIGNDNFRADVQELKSDLEAPTRGL